MSSMQRVVPLNESSQHDGSAPYSTVNQTEDVIIEEDDDAPDGMFVIDALHDDKNYNSSHNEEEEVGYSKLNDMANQLWLGRKLRRLKEIFTYEYIKDSTRWFLESASCQIQISFEDVTLLMTLFVLFADDIKLLCTTRVVDSDFSIAYAVCLFVFIFELLATSWSFTTVKSWLPLRYDGYFLSFFWWLDIIAILSLVPDVSLIAKPLGIDQLSDSVSSDSGSANYRTAGRIVRLVRLVRLVRVYKIASAKRERKQQEEQLMELVRIGAISYEDIENQNALYGHRQSRLGDQLSASTTRRVIIMILILLIILPLLIVTYPNRGPQFAVDMLHEFVKSPTVTQQARELMLDTFENSLTDSYNNRFIEFLRVHPSDLFEDESTPIIYYKAHLDTLRESAKAEYSLDSSNAAGYFSTSVIYSFRDQLRNQALYSILMTIFVAIMLVGGAVIFSNDAERLVIRPIERMINMVEAVAKDPLSKLQFDTHTSGAGAYETRLLESTIEKITGLLRVGFGEAGAGIISANLSADSSAAIDPLLPGVRIYAIFGFCDIHHFEDINQKLSNDVLTFVNTIAEIVHSRVHTWSGQCNKNLGNAFVIVWRIGDELTLQQNMGGATGRLRSMSQESMMSMKNSSTKYVSRDSMDSADGAASSEQEQRNTKKPVIDLRRIPGVDVLSDHALIGYLKIIAEINRNKAVLRYRQEPRLTENGTEEFKVRMGFGLHAGWAIEGAVGSLQKVDATYLSPHVNMAARLETSSKQYGVPLLASQDFFDLLSNDGQSVMRKLDVITVKGSEVPIGIYTYDAVQDQVFQEEKRGVKRPSINSLIGASTKETPNGAGATGGNAMASGTSSKLRTPAAAAAATAAATGTPVGGRPKSFSNASEGAHNGAHSPQKRPSFTNMAPGSNAEPTPIFMTPADNTGDIFDADYDLKTLRKHLQPEFIDAHKEGVSLYIAGDWAAAKSMLEKADAMMMLLAPSLGGDQPSRTLLSYMANRGNEAPPSWKGFRPLTSK